MSTIGTGKPRVLVVDDDEIVLAMYQRVLRSQFEADVATDGKRACEMAESGAYAVVVADMNMPEMTGLELLVHLHKTAPDTVRIMITSAHDQRTAADAVNSGHVFRFLPKPCRPDVFTQAVRDAAAHFRLVRHERELLEQTFNGVVEMLTGAFSACEPEALNLGQQLRERARRVGQAMKLPSTWELETAAMLLRLGMATIPAHVREKLRAHERLTPAEASLVGRIPEIGARLLAHIPRLAPVAEIIRHQGKSMGEAGVPDEGGPRKGVSLSARILHAVVDMQILESAGLEPAAALLRLRQESKHYDPDVLNAIERLGVRTQEEATEDVEECMVENLVSGLILASDAMSDEGVSLIAAGTQLTPLLVERLRGFSELGRVKEPLRVFEPKKAERGAAAAP
jgi:response regulator RpfG family c-di-GMP phosphodiesterase